MGLIDLGQDAGEKRFGRGVAQATMKESAASPSDPATLIAGDALSKVARRYYGDASCYPVIFEANEPMLMAPDRIYPGQKLRIPA